MQGLAPLSHSLSSHPGELAISKITNLQTELANRSLVGHGHGDYADKVHSHNYADKIHIHEDYAPVSHPLSTHTGDLSINRITNLQTELSNRSIVGHEHSQYSLTTHSHSGFSLVGHAHTDYAPVVHSHGIAQINSLQSTLEEKAPLADPIFSGSPKVGTQNIVLSNDDRLSDARIPLTHYHDYSLINHNHHTVYSQLSHTHEYAPITHSHGISQITDLSNQLAAKAPLANPVFTGTPKVGTNNIVVNNDARLTDARSPLPHSHSEYASTNHVHSISQVSTLQDTLNGKAALSHPLSTHTGDLAISRITDLETTLNTLEDEIDGKAPMSHFHAISNVAGLQDALNGKAPTSHSHSISNVTDLQDSLNGKAPLTHNHGISQITDLSNQLSLKAPLQNPVFTGTPKVGTQNIVVNNDARLTDARTPLTHYHDYSPSNHNHHSVYSQIGHGHNYAPITHSHGAGEITSGTLPVARGGTGQTTISGTKTALGIPSFSLSGTTLTITLP